MPWKDKNKRLKSRRDWYQKNKKWERQRINFRLRELKKWYKEYKTTLKCNRCPENHPACLDFHHPDDDKTDDIAVMVHDGYSKENILKEIAKCEVLCANCHRKLHA